MGHLSLVDLRSVEVWDRAFLSVYRNRIVSFSRLSKRLNYEAYFTTNLKNMKKTRQGINELLNRQRNRNQQYQSFNAQLTLE